MARVLLIFSLSFVLLGASKCQEEEPPPLQELSGTWNISCTLDPTPTELFPDQVNHFIDFGEDSALATYRAYGTWTRRTASGSYSVGDDKVTLFDVNGDVVSEFAVTSHDENAMIWENESETCSLEVDPDFEVLVGLHEVPDKVIAEVDVLLNGLPLFVDVEVDFPFDYRSPQLLKFVTINQTYDLAFAVLSVEEGGDTVADYSWKILLYEDGEPVASTTATSGCRMCTYSLAYENDVDSLEIEVHVPLPPAP